MHVLATAVAAAMIFIAANTAIAQTASSVPGNLQRVGALHCLATRAEGSATTRLQCDLRLADVDVQQEAFEGVLYGEGLYLVAPGEVRTLWSVLSPTRRLEPAALEGDYDIVSKHGFAYAQEHPNLLIGGMNDVVALELISPRVDPIEPSTRLTLRRAS